MALSIMALSITDTNQKCQLKTPVIAPSAESHPQPIGPHETCETWPKLITQRFALAKVASAA
jgi:hypothetical protein